MLRSAIRITAALVLVTAAALAQGTPTITEIGVSSAGNPNFALEVDPQGPAANVWLAIDVGPPAAPLNTPFGTLHVDPQEAVILNLGPTTAPALVPLPLPTGALGTSAVQQAVVLRPDGAVQLSFANWTHVWVVY